MGMDIRVINDRYNNILYYVLHKMRKACSLLVLSNEPAFFPVLTEYRILASHFVTTVYGAFISLLSFACSIERDMSNNNNYNIIIVINGK